MTKNQPSVRAARWSPALPIVLTLWGLILLLSLYQAKAVRDEIDKSELLRDQAWLREGVTAAMRFADAIGVSKVRAHLGELRTAVNAPYTVLVSTESPDGDGGDGLEAIELPSDMAHTTGRRPRRVLIIGASSIQFAIGVELEKLLPRAYDQVKVKRYGQLATGLSRPDFMNWPEKLHSLAKPFKPDLIICNFGGNDAQPIPDGEYERVEYGTAEWDDKYAERVTEIIDIGKEYGADTVMIGMPIMRSPAFSKKMRRLNRVMKAATEKAGMLFVPTYNMASTPEGEYRTTIKFKGKRGLMRTSDGVHYTRLGARFVIEQVMQHVERRYRLEPKSKKQASAQRHGFESPTSNGKKIWYTAYVPQGLTAPRPAVVLLPDADEWGTWPNFPHRRLQTWAQALQVVLVVPENAHETAYVGPYAAILRDELPHDLKQHLPVASVAYAGAGRGALSALAVGSKSAGLFLYRPWDDPSQHATDPALIEALGEPAANTGPWGSNGWVRRKGPSVLLQANKRADPLRKALDARLLDAGPPAATFEAALDAGLAVLVPPPDDDIAPDDVVPR